MSGYRILRIPDYLEMYGVPIKSLVDGWKERGRRGGEAYASAPRAVGVHHTAGGDNFSANRGWQYYQSASRPIGNGTMFRDGSVMVGCSGPSNTQGAGGPVWSTRGAIPKDSGNGLFVSWEATNDGVSQSWTDVQIENYPKLVAATLHMLNDDFPTLPKLTVGQCFSHFEWSNPLAPLGPSRKPDPWGPAPPYATAVRQKWDMDVFRGRVFASLNPTPPPTPPSPPPVPPTPAPAPTAYEENDAMWIIAKTTDGPHLASRGIRTGAMHVSDVVPLEYVFADGQAFDLGSRRVVTLNSWPAVAATLSKAQALAVMGAQV